MLTKYDLTVKSPVGTRVGVSECHLNSISLYKGVFMEPLRDKFFWLIASTFSSDLTPGWCRTQCSCWHFNQPQKPMRGQGLSVQICVGYACSSVNNNQRQFCIWMFNWCDLWHSISQSLTHISVFLSFYYNIEFLSDEREWDVLRHLHQVNDNLGSLACLSLLLFAPLSNKRVAQSFE